MKKSKVRLSAVELQDIFLNVLRDFKADLISDLKKINESKLSINFDDHPVSTSEVCRRWGKSRTTVSRLVKLKLLVPSGKFKREFLFLTSDIIKAFGQPIL